jgi:hypothetical protein
MSRDTELNGLVIPLGKSLSQFADQNNRRAIAEK